MKIALVTAYYYPQSHGGTEKYVHSLAKHLQSKGHSVHVITSYGEEITDYLYLGVKTFVLPAEKRLSNEIIVGDRPSLNIIPFEQLLLKEAYDNVHFHTLTPLFNIFHIQVAKKVGANVYFTAHVPGLTCIRGDLLKFGLGPCDGLVTKQRCTACFIQKMGYSKSLAVMLSTSVIFARYPKNLSGVVTKKLLEMHMLNSLIDKIFIFTHWQERIFLMNGFSAEKLEKTSQLFEEIIPFLAVRKKVKNIGFVGRICPEKGIQSLIDAFKIAKRFDINLNIAGIINEVGFYTELRKKSEGLSNIKWNINLKENELNAFYQKVDLIVIPSTSFETGPFVLFEALKMKIPILANNLGDLQSWQEKGYDIQLYSSQQELIAQIKTL